MLNVDGKLILIITSKSLLRAYRLQDMKCSCENRIKQAYYVLVVVSLKLDCHELCCGNVMEVVCLWELGHNLICPSF